ncbi:MAG: hypothetical protein RLZZ584_3500 [Pseudomonadota bacterium]|jgi:hypothetical protein
MHAHTHSLSQLFAQLGLPEEPAAVEAFISSHRPLPSHLRLAEAPFWSPAQAELLASGVADDADWAEVVDTLDSLLRH